MPNRMMVMQVEVDTEMTGDLLASAAIEGAIRCLLENDVDAAEVMGALTLHLGFMIKLFSAPPTEIH